MGQQEVCGRRPVQFPPFPFAAQALTISPADHRCVVVMNVKVALGLNSRLPRPTPKPGNVREHRQVPESVYLLQRKSKLIVSAIVTTAQTLNNPEVGAGCQMASSPSAVSRRPGTARFPKAVDPS